MFIFKSMKKQRSSFKTFLLLFTIAFLLFLGWLGWVLFMPSTTTEHYTINYPVMQGETFNQVLLDLDKVGIIRSPLALKFVRALFGFSLKKGEYELSPSMSGWAILKTLSSGKPPLVKITFPEGFSLSDMAKRLQEKGFSNTGDFLSVVKNPSTAKMFGLPNSSLEGFLFPSTYYVPKTIDSLDLVKLMVKTFLDKTASLYPSSDTLKKIYPTVILASLIEKEAVVEKDRPLIASVFLNRIHKNMRLESCATIIYVFETRGIKKNRVYYKDLQVDSPYNTYKHAGLPPAPISNPGIDSLKAAFAPAHTDYLFFAYKGNGEHIFSDNYASHMKAYKKYIQYQNIRKN